MAQQDTGLGWSAKEEWLLQGAGELADISSGGGQLPVFNNPSKLDIQLNGVTLWLNPNNGQWCKAVAGSPGVYGFAQKGSTSLVPGAIATSNTAVFYYAYSYSSSVLTRTINTAVPNHSGWYFQTVSQGITTSVNPTSDVPVYEAASSGDAAGLAVDDIMSMSFQISKSSLGYAVACVVKWKTQNGTELISPILISSNTDYADMSATSSTYNLAKFNGLLNGVRFYMGFWDIPSSASVTSSLQALDLTERGNLDLQTLFMILISTNNAHVIIITSPDPYEEEGGESGEEGGDGEDLEDDEMGISHHAIPAAINTGFCRIYCPNAQQLRDLSNFLWSAQYDLTAVKKLFANPMDSVLGLSAVPLNLSGANAAVYLGGVDTEMSFPMVSYQSYQVPMGAITVDKRWGSYLDYDPYTKFSIYLPFIGFKDLSADDIMGRQIILDYDVDILSGACTARLQAGANVLYQWSGQCSIQLPVTASNWNQVFQSATSAALSAGLAVATGSAGPVLAGALAAEGAQAIMGKPRIERGGSSSGAAGWMGGLTPYLVRVTPEAIIPNDQNKFIGYPAFSSISLGNLTGYNEISSIHLEGIPATGAELDELETILKGGVIF